MSVAMREWEHKKHNQQVRAWEAWTGEDWRQGGDCLEGRRHVDYWGTCDEWELDTPGADGR
jgi:hypothetical protein